MQTARFSTRMSNINCRGVIALTDGSEIDIFYLKEEPYTPAPNKLQLYGEHGDRLFAFEMEFNPANIEEFGAALKWYARLRLMPDMDLMLNDPRPLVN
jgi:hypothetical protein